MSDITKYFTPEALAYIDEGKKDLGNGLYGFERALTCPGPDTEWERKNCNSAILILANGVNYLEYKEPSIGEHENFVGNKSCMALDRDGEYVWKKSMKV